MFFGNRGRSFNPSSDIPNLSGKVIIVTGGNVGLGKETILQLVRHDPRRIFLAARTESKARAAIEEIESQVPEASGKITFLHLDLTSFDSIRTTAANFSKASSRLDLLINNAGIMAVPASTSREGYEIQFATNHMGHALLTQLLLPTLIKTAEQPSSPDVRIVTLSSSMQAQAPPGGILFNQLATPMEATSTWTRYAQSKAANILYAAELARLYPQLTSVAVHPGFIDTELSSTFKSGNVAIGMVFNFFGKFMLQDVAQGARNQLWAATAPKDQLRSGTFYYPVGAIHAGSGYPENRELAEKLWTWTETELAKHVTSS